MKKILSLVVTAILILSMTACGAKTEKNPAVTDISAKIITELSLGETVALTDNTLPKQYSGIDLSNVAEYSANVSASGALADEVSIFRASDSAAKDKIKAVLNDRVTALDEKFRDYIPDEMTKIEGAVIADNGNYIMLAVVSDGEKAKTLFNEFFK